MWWTSAIAAAGPCEDALDMLARGLNAQAVAREMDETVWEPANVACLAENQADFGLVRAVSRASGIPAPPDGKAHAWALSLGPAWLPSPQFATSMLADAHLTWFVRPEIGFDLEAGVGIRLTAEPLIGGLRKPVISEPLPEHIEDGLRDQASLAVLFAPIAGEIHLGRNVAALRAFVGTGLGFVHTQDDVDEVLRTYGQDFTTDDQAHFALRFGGGVEILSARHTGVRISADALRWVETYQDTALAIRTAATVTALLTTRP